MSDAIKSPIKKMNDAGGGFTLASKYRLSKIGLRSFDKAGAYGPCDLPTVDKVKNLCDSRYAKNAKEHPYSADLVRTFCHHFDDFVAAASEEARAMGLSTNAKGPFVFWILTESGFTYSLKWDDGDEQFVILPEGYPYPLDHASETREINVTTRSNEARRAA